MYEASVLWKQPRHYWKWRGMNNNNNNNNDDDNNKKLIKYYRTIYKLLSFADHTLILQTVILADYICASKNITYFGCLLLRPLLPPTTGLLKCSGWVKGNWSRVSLSLKCLPLFKHNAVLRRVVISPSSKTETK